MMAINPLLNGYKLQENTNNPGQYLSADDYLKLFDQSGNSHQQLQQWLQEYASKYGEAGLGYKGPGSARDMVQNQNALEGNPNYAAAKPTALMQLQEKPYQQPTPVSQLLGNPQGLLGTPPKSSNLPPQQSPLRFDQLPAMPQQRSMGIPHNQDRYSQLMQMLQGMRSQTKPGIQGQSRQPQQYQPGRAYHQSDYSSRYGRQPTRGYRPNRYTGRGLLGY